MRTRSRLLLFGALLLCGTGILLVWMSPLLLAGRMYDVPPMLAARNFAASGCFTLMDDLGRFLRPDLLCTLGTPMPFDGRVSIVLLGWISQWVPFSSLVHWSLLSSCMALLTLLGWWVTMADLFDRKLAWTSSALLAFMPFFWREAVWLDYYSVSYVFLAWSAAAYVLLHKRSEYLALLVSGLLFGLCAGAKDVFLIFLPWILVSYCFSHRAHGKRVLVAMGIFFFCIGLVYLLPYIGDIRTLGYPVNYNLARIWPGAAKLQEAFYLHLYPDPYTYLFNRDAFDAQFLARYADMSLLEKLRIQKSFISFDVGDFGLVPFFLNGVWLFLGALPTLFQQATMGGVVLWIFILPGVILLLRERKTLFFFLTGLVLSAELVIRFVLHYSRDHIMDYGWILALLAALGVLSAGKSFAASQKRFSVHTVSLLIVVILCLQLLQANRVVFAHRYSRTFVPQIEEIAHMVNTAPEEAVFAMGIGSSRIEQVAQQSNRTIAMFDESTVNQLLHEGVFHDVMELYDVTHFLGYSKELQERIQKESSAYQVLPLPPEAAELHVTPVQNFLLHLIR
ncbi:hypothetical protein COU76_02080 [Candidatus Peregrinibacteria bacterium CG10_big_fil_rev_8_21_14_0_10_49_10]|nr:MAG: hypothetical protein COU76_02080 [Candidatus Peregrinibacteria bacterium CG10_big_fil_rev_8_21_14_0_10_49_10]